MEWEKWRVLVLEQALIIVGANASILSLANLLTFALAAEIG